MADVNLIINSMNIIANAQYQGRAQSRKSIHEIAFDRLQGSAQQIAAILTQNPAPNADTRENLQALFDGMQNDVSGYCTKTDNTTDIVRAFSKAGAEWELLVAGK